MQQSVAGAKLALGKREPTPSCAAGVALQTVWFTFTYTASPGFAVLVWSTFQTEDPGLWNGVPPIPIVNASDFDTVLAAYV
ncbi:MAG TPA: hypothetical protein VMU14_13415, partial [Acidimicrobiales bacterium]|nr:hypothetical protein [Acidimicrobiales bacterium]